MFGGSIGCSKSPFKTSTGAAGEASITPIALAMTIDFDNFISSPRLIIPMAFDHRTTRLPARCPSHNPFVRAIGHVFFEFLFGFRVYSALRLEHFAAKHATKIAKNLSTFIAVEEAINGFDM
ncbi:MAG: hypothetical protein ABSD29_23770 [Verrucomicrobiota bacterium]